VWVVSEAFGPATQALYDYLDGEDDIAYQLRMEWTWQEAAFERLLGVGAACLSEVGGAPLVPRHVVAFGASYLPYLERMLSNPAFLQHNDRGSPEATRAYFDQRRAEIAKLREWVASGGSAPPW
jgi:hypothetical protein